MKDAIHRLTGGMLVVDVQSDLLHPAATRVVVPLVPAPAAPLGQPNRLTPTLKVEGRPLMLLPLQMAAVPLRELDPRPVRKLTEPESYAVRGALGVLFDGV